jgi:LysR family transcriptional regulator, glycine cleavage system transcriptional activator
MKFIHSKISTTATQHIPSIMALRSFERAAARLSFKLAAQELAMTPSAVSHQVRGLERQFGVRLFARTGRNVALTLEGERYLISVKSALSLLEKGGRTLAPIASGQREIRISALPYFVSAVILPRLNEFLQKFPGITLRLETSTQYADLESSGVDLAIRMGRERTAGLHVDKLLDVRAIPVCAASLTQGKHPIKKASDFAHHTLMQSTQYPSMWHAWLIDAGVPSLEPAGEMWFDNVQLTLEAAQLGLGVALAMDPIIRAWPGFGDTLVAPLSVKTKTVLTYYAVCRPEQKDERAMLALRRWLMQITRDHSSGN